MDSCLESFYFGKPILCMTFSAEQFINAITIKKLEIKYENQAKLMSLEIKYAGGLKRAVEEIEFFVSLEGNLDRFAPFQSTLPFYQRYILDLLIIFILLPGMITIYTIYKCCIQIRRRRRKEKRD